MKRIAILCAGLLTLAVSQSHASLNIAWGKCVGSGGTTDVTFDCDSTLGSVYELVASFQITSPLANFVAMDGTLDFTDESSTDLPAFWQFQGPGCNHAGIELIDDRSTVCSPKGNPWGTGGGLADAVITAYGAGYPTPNRGRLLLTIARSTSNTVNLLNSTAYFAFRLRFHMDNAVSCSGCGDAIYIIWTRAVLFSITVPGGEYPPPVVLDGMDRGSNPAAYISALVPTRPQSWGAIKALYR